MDDLFDDGTVEAPGSKPIPNTLHAPIGTTTDPDLRRAAAQRQRDTDPPTPDEARVTLDVGAGVPGLARARRVLDQIRNPF